VLKRTARRGKIASKEGFASQLHIYFLLASCAQLTFYLAFYLLLMLPSDSKQEIDACLFASF
jgi:hypothetical protein